LPGISQLPLSGGDASGGGIACRPDEIFATSLVCDAGSLLQESSAALAKAAQEILNAVDARRNVSPVTVIDRRRAVGPCRTVKRSILCCGSADDRKFTIGFG